MNDTIWLKTQHPNFLLNELRDRRLSRKRRLFAGACCRRIWTLLTDPRCRNAVDVAEQFADGEVSRPRLSAAYEQVRLAMGDLNASEPTAPRQLYSARNAAQAVVHTAAKACNPHITAHCAACAAVGADTDEIRAQVDLIRDIFGNPFRPVAIETDWLAWNHATVPAIARHIYDDGAFHDLPILADALEDAGCTNADLLAHCRGPGPHVRGCWAVDLLLGKG